MSLKPYILSLFLLFSSYFYGQDDELVINAVATAHKKERKLLDSIQSNQDNILVITTLLAASSAEVVLLEQKMHNSLIKVYDVIDNASIIIQIVNESAEIIKWQDMIYEVAKDHPDAMIVAGLAEIEMLKRAKKAMIKLLRATKESKFNFLTNKDRLDLLTEVLGQLLIIKKASQYIYNLTSSVVFTSPMDQMDFLYDNLNLDYQSIYDEAMTNYEKMFNK